MSLPLAGVRVLDASRLLPGPYATLVLSDLGARVDKLEEPNGGDYLRHMPPMRGDESALFIALNRNKRSLVLDLKAADGAAAFRDVLGSYDVFVESFRPGVMDKLGLGVDALRTLHPRLIVCSISGYGQTGPDRLKAGHDIGYIAKAGVLGLSGGADDVPAAPGAQIADVGGALFADLGILAALFERTRTGTGRFLDISMTEAAMAFIHMHLGARVVMGGEGAPLRRGREMLNGGFPGYGVYRTKDGRALSVGALEPKFFERLAAALGDPTLLDGAYDLGPRADAIGERLRSIFRTRTAAEWMAVFGAIDACVELIPEGDEIQADPQLRERGNFVRAEGREHLLTPLRLGPIVPAPAPALGEHSKEILLEAGLDPVRVARILGAS